jgi:hypothetical protein
MAMRMKMKRRPTGDYEDDGEDNGMLPLQSGSRPDPDPTARTMQLVDRAIRNLKAELSPRFDAVDIRFDGIDLATKLQHEDYVRVPTVVQEAVKNVRELLLERVDSNKEHINSLHNQHDKIKDLIKDGVDNLRELIFAEITGRDRVDDEIFKRIETQFVERDKRTEQLALASSTAIAAALQAQKEAAGATTDSILAVITKMDASFTKLFDQMANLLTAQQKNTDDKINDLKSRMDKGEGIGQVRDPAQAASILWMERELGNNRSRTDTTVAHAKGAEDNWKNLVIIGMFAIAAAAFLLRPGVLH